MFGKQQYYSSYKNDETGFNKKKQGWPLRAGKMGVARANLGNAVKMQGQDQLKTSDKLEEMSIGVEKQGYVMVD